MGMAEMMDGALFSIWEARKRFMRWWLPVWFGPPCRHGVYGARYRDDRDWVPDCRYCWREISAECDRREAAEEAERIRKISGPMFAAMDARIKALEDRATKGMEDAR